MADYALDDATSRGRFAVIFQNIKFLAIITMSLAGSGCARMGTARVEPVTMAVYPGAKCLQARQPRSAIWGEANLADSRPGAVDLGCFQFPEDWDPENDDIRDTTAYIKAVADATGEKRNRLAAILLKQADDVCTSEKALMLVRQAQANGTLSIATTGLSTASAVVTGDLAKSILAGGAALASGSRDHINTHGYRNQIIQTVTKAIDTERLRLYGLINPNLTKGTAAYSVDVMIRDVNAYHQACSFTMGLQIVMESVERRAEYDKMSKLQSLDDQIRTLADIYRQGGPTSSDAAAQMQLLQKERIRQATGVTPN